MSKPRLICHVPASTTADGAKSRTRALPNDILQEASRRLAIMSLLGAVLWLLGTVFYHVAMRALAPGNSNWIDRRATDAISAVTAAVPY
jgi:hypothetical protein